MSKKHFKALAEALKYEKPSVNWCPNKMAQWINDVRAIADVCASANPNFDREKFYIASGGVDNE